MSCAHPPRPPHPRIAGYSLPHSRSAHGRFQQRTRGAIRGPRPRYRFKSRVDPYRRLRCRRPRAARLARRPSQRQNRCARLPRRQHLHGVLRRSRRDRHGQPLLVRHRTNACARSRESFLQRRRGCYCGIRRASRAETQSGIRRNIQSGTSRLRVTPPIDAANDWAVVRLETPVCRAGGIALSQAPREEIEIAAMDGGVYQVSMHRDVSAETLVAGKPCRIAREFPGATRRGHRPRFLRQPVRAPPHLRHRPRFLGIAATDRRSVRSRGGRHQRRHVYSVAHEREE